MLMLSSKTMRVERRTWVERWRQWRMERQALEDALLSRNKYLLDDAGMSHEEARDSLSLWVSLKRLLRPPDGGL